MAAQPPLLSITPREEPCHAATRWSAETFTLEVHFQGAPRPQATTLSAQLNRRFSIEPLPYRLVLGDVEVMLTEVGRLQSIEVYTNIEQWQRTRLPALPASPQHVWSAFDVEYDGNHIASLDIPCTILWDAAARQVAIRLGTECTPSAWYAVADTVFFALTPQGRLCEVRCTAVATHLDIKS